jgi:hypothetical protein
VQRRIQRALFHRERVRGRGVDPLRDLVAVLLAFGERPQDEELEGALQQVGGLVCSHKYLRAGSLPSSAYVSQEAGTPGAGAGPARVP